MSNQPNHNSQQWSQEVWQQVQPIIDRIMELPFVQELAQGVLPDEKFTFYLQQDSLYLHNYCKVLCHIASRLERTEHTAAFIEFARDGVAVEQAMHQVFLSGRGQANGMSPSCRLYTAVQSAQSEAPVEEEVASILPCFWVYLEVGKRIAAVSASENPYAQWIATYSDPGFEASTARAVAICDELAASASPDVRRRMTEIFVECTKLEWMFWESAYRQETWPV